ncbi:tRNA (adenosine(37)-N6)-threonylcarbamoyltransferase complex dimerization subunit type 1 TsaB [Caminibacter profundus]
MSKLLVDVVVIPIATPMLVGIYENGKLIREIKKSGMTSDILPEIFDEILCEYNIKHIIYAKGPGSYMSIKLAFIFFKTLEIAKSIKLLAQDGFYFNNNTPIKAVGNSFFLKKDGIISIEKNLKEGEFKLPRFLNLNDFSEDTSPLYVLKAV